MISEDLVFSLAHSPTHSLIHQLTHSFTNSLTHSPTHSTTHSLTNSLTAREQEMTSHDLFRTSCIPSRQHCRIIYTHQAFQRGGDHYLCRLQSKDIAASYCGEDLVEEEYHMSSVSLTHSQTHTPSSIRHPGCNKTTLCHPYAVARFFCKQ